MEIKNFLAKYHIHPNEDQGKAISHGSGPALVLAGPGSGKTTVITARCAWLVHLMDTGVLPAAGILTVAFNRAAAREMAQRYENVFGNRKPAGRQVDFSTFHAFCNRIISRYEQKTGFSLERIDETKREQILAELYEKRNHILLSPTERRKLAGEISRQKNNLSAQVVLSMSNFKNLPDIYDSYTAYKREQHWIDFDDMLFEAKEILITYPEILQEIQKIYGFFQVDEGQDLSQVQMEILTMLGNNVFLVGDDDQGIYGFRGARPESIVHMDQYFPHCTTYYLKQNYRSTEQIVDISSAVIRQNAVRLDKIFFTEKGRGAHPKCKVFLDDRDWLGFLYAKISNPGSGTCGILYRNGASSVLPMLMCHKNGIPFGASGGQGNFFTSFVSQDLLALFAYEAGQKRWFQKRPEKLLREYLASGYLRELRTRCETMSLRYADMLRYVSAWDYLTAGLHSCEDAPACFENFQKAAESAAAKKDSGADSDGCRVHLSTVHSAKGLEYDTVFIIDLYEGEFPKRCGDEELCEERRLFYVAMTRARKQLYLLYPAKRFGLELNPSLFWKEVQAAKKQKQRT